MILLVWGCWRKIQLIQSPAIALLLFCLSVAFATNNYTYFGSMEYIAVGKRNPTVVVQLRFSEILL